MALTFVICNAHIGRSKMCILQGRDCDSPSKFIVNESSTMEYKLIRKGSFKFLFGKKLQVHVALKSY